ncbi:MAG: beta-galactosidase [Bryobacteraceae bacterium]
MLFWPRLAAYAQHRTVIRPKDDGAALVNPSMGWVLHHFDNDIVRYGSKLEPWDTVDDFPGVGVIYLRLAWTYLEPQEGKFNWLVVDIPAQRWIAKGKKIAFRFTTYESLSNNPPNATPEWAVKAGARVFPVRGRGAAAPERYEQDYDDPIFLAKLDHFLAAAAARYDGDPNVAWIDVGTIGIWGDGDPGPERFTTAGTVKRHIDLHTKHFKRTLIAFNDNLMFRGMGLVPIVYAKQQGLTLRDDSVLCHPGQEAVYTHYYAGAFWPRLPVILESEHYGPPVQPPRPYAGSVCGYS